MKKNSEINNIENQVVILDKADEKFLDLIKKFNVDLNDSCFLIDIEGSEYNLLNDKILNELKRSKLIIELHLDEENQNKLLTRLKNFFNLQILTTSNRDLSKFKFLENFQDIDRWLLVSENRPSMMRWVVCIPK